MRRAELKHLIRSAALHDQAEWPKTGVGSVRRPNTADPGLEPSEFDIRNKRLKELCRHVDRLSPEDQNVICHVMDSLIRKERMKTIISVELLGSPRREPPGKSDICF